MKWAAPSPSLSLAALSSSQLNDRPSINVIRTTPSRGAFRSLEVFFAQPNTDFSRGVVGAPTMDAALDLEVSSHRDVCCAVRAIERVERGSGYKADRPSASDVD